MDSSNLVLLRGTLSSAPRVRELPSGSTLAQLEVTTPHPEGARSVPVAWFDPPSSFTDRLAEGIELAVVGHVRRRFFRAGGATQSRTEVIAERVALGSRRRDIERLLEIVTDRLAPG